MNVKLYTVLQFIRSDVSAAVNTTSAKEESERSPRRLSRRTTEHLRCYETLP